jgi:crossover junction endodeoxyribonuclease RuvC
VLARVPGVIVVGVDPSTKRLGYAVLRSTNGGPLTYVTAGVITARDRDPLVKRLDELARGLEEVCAEVDPSNDVILCGIEAGFVKGQTSAIVLGAARGVASLVMWRRFGVEVREYAPLSVKLAATGRGNAEKEDVARIVAKRLGLRVVPDGDTGDALAVAIARAQDSTLLRAR